MAIVFFDDEAEWWGVPGRCLLFGGEVGVEDVRAGFRGDAVAGVGDVEDGTRTRVPVPLWGRRMGADAAGSPPSGMAWTALSRRLRSSCSERFGVEGQWGFSGARRCDGPLSCWLAPGVGQVDEVFA